MDFIDTYLKEVETIAQKLDKAAIEKLITALVELRNGGGRLFILGVGGSAGNASHAVNDFRKIVGIEAYAPTDNVSELSARTNDEGWASVFAAWLQTGKLSSKDAILIFSVGGGDAERNVSANLVEAIKLAKSVGAKVFGIVGPKGGYTAKEADACVLIPEASSERITPHSEAFQVVVWHLLVSDPRLKAAQTKWESLLK